MTGGAGAIGQAIASGLVAKGYDVTVVVRTARQGEAVVKTLQKHASAPAAYETCDLSVRKDIIALAQRWTGPLHVLINNAATCPSRRTENTEGIEMQFATNVLGYYRMINAFEEVLRKSAPARVVNVASYWAGGLNMNDLEFRRRAYDNDTAYRQSKQADRMITRAFAERFKGAGITVNSCHPGDVRSKLSGDLGFGGHESPQQGAATPLFLATASEIDDVTGTYFAHQKAQHCGFSENTDAVIRLFDKCGEYDSQHD